MPARRDIKSVLIIGAGPIVIGQACEFDYSGAQACKALREEGYRTVLANSNPATIMTDPDLADATYIEPITPDFLARIIEKERPDAVLATMGGQTALNTALALDEQGVLARFNVEMIGANREAIARAEDRHLFREVMRGIGLETPRAYIARNPAEAEKAARAIGMPAIIRPSFTLGGWGGGIARSAEEFALMAAKGIAASPRGEVLIEEPVLGWKEYEMEVVRDRRDNCIIVCSIENIDPMGIHTGDSMTVAPALTLTDKEYQAMRSAAIAVLRAIGVETGGSNVQFAVDPRTGRMLVIEMNPRVSRSSALASKATGFPIAKIAALLAVGYTLDELSNDITGVTPASFEPSIDYIVTKIPRFAFEKFPAAAPHLTTSMQSVGEAMAIGRSFPESLQKALCSLEMGLAGLDEIAAPDDDVLLLEALRQPTPDRLRLAAQALRRGLAEEKIAAATGIDPWFIEQIGLIIAAEAKVKNTGLPEAAEDLRALKMLGFSDERLAALTGKKEQEVRALRHRIGVRPVFKRIDSCAAEFAAQTAYMYSCYERPAIGVESCEALPSARRKAMILGGGPNRIGQGIEFDYCCCHAAFALAGAGVESIMVNCNPETVSTDYDTSDRLYFEPLTVEAILEIAAIEQSSGEFLGVIIQFGGQTPLKLARPLRENGVAILGTDPDATDLAEDRERFRQLIGALGLNQPRAASARSAADARKAAAAIGYPVMVRPSYVLGGRAMEIVHDEERLTAYMAGRGGAAGEPVLIDDYLSDAIEVDVDALGARGVISIAGIMEHIEEAGIHSGDSACVLPPHSLPPDCIDKIEDATRRLGGALKICGLMNIQYAVREGVVYILEANPRASRTAPFVAKATHIPLIRQAVRAMLGEESALPPRRVNGQVAVKEAVFPFARFAGVDTVLGPEMRSTGEVMGIAPDFATAFLKSQIGAGGRLPEGGTVFVSVREQDKPFFAALAARLVALGFRVLATHGTADFLAGEGLTVERINKVREGTPHIVEAILAGRVHLMFNTTEGAQSLRDSFSLRRAALMRDIPYYTTRAGAKAAVDGIAILGEADLAVYSLQELAKSKRGVL